MFQHAVDVLSISRIVSFILRTADGPTVHAVLAAFRPPSVQDGAVGHAVHGGFHARGAGGFQRPNRVVQPDVNTAGHREAGIHVVVLDESHGNLTCNLFGRCKDVPDQLFPPLVLGMGFAAEHELDSVSTNGTKSLKITKDEVGSLVSGKSSRKADGQPLFVKFHAG